MGRADQPFAAVADFGPTAVNVVAFTLLYLYFVAKAVGVLRRQEEALA